MSFSAEKLVLKDRIMKLALVPFGVVEVPHRLVITVDYVDEYMTVIDCEALRELKKSRERLMNEDGSEQDN